MRARSKSASAGFDGLTQPRTTLFEKGNADAARSATPAVSTGWAVTAPLESEPERSVAERSDADELFAESDGLK